MRTFLRANASGDDRLAARALDLAAIPVRAQSDIGPTLARKLKFVIDQVGPPSLQETPNEVEGPRYVYYRGPLGQISLEAAAAGPRKRDWLFTAETVSQIEPMFLAALDRRPASSSALSGNPRKTRSHSPASVFWFDAMSPAGSSFRFSAWVFTSGWAWA